MKKTIILIIACIALVACGNSKQQKQPIVYAIPDTIDVVQGNGKIVPESGILKLASEVSGTVKEIKVQSGQFVKKDEILLIIDPQKAELNVAQAKNQVNSQNFNVKEVEAKLTQSKIDYQNALNDLSTAEKLYSKGAETKQKVLDLRKAADIKKAEMEENAHNLEKEKSILKEKNDELNIAQEDLNYCMIRAPKDGEVLDIDIEKGNMVQPYQNLITFAADEPIIVEAEVDELFANRLKIGQSAKIHLIGYSEPIATGKIFNMSNYLSDKSIFSGETNEKLDRQMRKIKILLDNQENTPLIGTKVSCDINLNSVK